MMNIQGLKRKIRVICHRFYTKSMMQKYLSKKYLKYIGYPMDWKNPQSYTQKIQYTKINTSSPLKCLCCDKIAVRDYVAQVVGEKYLIPVIGEWESPKDIEWDKMPNAFVLKTNHGSATNIIVKDINNIEIEQVIRKMSGFLKDDFAYYGFELQYAPIKPKVYAEVLLEFEDSGIEDYKFLCFDGEPKFFWIDFNRHTNHKRNMYDMNWNLQPWNQWHYGNYEGVIKKPDNFEEMVSVARALCRGFDHVRVDLYNVKGKIYFGELTFTNGGGFEHIVPKEMDFKLGEYWKLP